MASAFWQSQLETAYQQAADYQAAITALTTGGAQEYTLDTGQDRQTVKKLDLEWLQKNLDKILNDISVLEKRCGVSVNVNIMRPGRCS